MLDIGGGCTDSTFHDIATAVKAVIAECLSCPNWVAEAYASSQSRATFSLAARLS
jgi:hypothetical protein